MKTLATVLATPLFSFYCYFLFVLYFRLSFSAAGSRVFSFRNRDQIAHFRPLSATQSPLSALSAAPRSHFLGLNPRPSRRCQPCLLRPDRTFPARTRDQVAAVSLVFCAPTAAVSLKPATTSPLPALFPVPRPRFVRPQSRSDRACSLHRRAPTAAVGLKPAT